MGTEDAIRGYVITLRNARDVTQDDMAEVVGLKKRAYIDYEKGRTPDIWAAGLLAAVRHLRGSFEHLRDLARPGSTYEDGRAMAEMRLREEAGNELAALRATIPDDEFEAYLNEIEQDAVSSAQVAARLRELLHRRSPGPRRRRG